MIVGAVCAAFSAQAQLLWKVEGNGLAKPSYIFGTHHVAPSDMISRVSGLTEALDAVCKEDNGMHYWDDYIYIEIIDPVTLEPLPDGELGEVVITTLVKEGAPLIRYRTHDLSRILPGECACGSKIGRAHV